MTFRIITWNMQGATDSVESKWSKGVAFLFTQAQADVICLQEVGEGPLNRTPLAAPGWATAAPPPGSNWSYLRWRPFGEEYYLFWYEWDVNGGRVNLAVCSRVPATALIYVDPRLPDARPAIGMALDRQVLTLHAYSPKGPDAPSLVAAVNSQVGKPWRVAGDFNRDPSSWTPPQGSVICPPDRATYPYTKGRYDYLVRSGGTPQVGFVIDSFVVSDHYPVIYDE